jgi:hypothetical protein
MNTIALSLSAAIALLRDVATPEWIKDELQSCVEKIASSAPVAVMCETATLTLNRVCAPDVNKIKCIAAVRHNLGWGLKEAKDWVEIVVGKADYSKGYYNDMGEWVPSVTYNGGVPAALVGPKRSILELERAFRSLKCDVSVTNN